VKLEFHPAASEEFIEAGEYYEAALPGLGRRFLLAVRKTTELAREHSESGVPGPGSSRRLAVSGFPYDIVYRRRDDDLLEVLAVAHQRRRPGYWRERMPR
jgi:toxin ParE1/3/4